MRTVVILAVLGVLLLVGVSPSVAQFPVTLQNGTATISQYSPGASGNYFSPDQCYDGNISGGAQGWQIHTPMPAGVDRGIAVFETGQNIGPGTMTIVLHHQSPSNYGMLLGRFRLSVTTDDRSTFADGSANNGAVTACWTVLSSLTTMQITLPPLAPAMSFTTLSDGSILTWGSIMPGSQPCGYVPGDGNPGVPENADYSLTFNVPNLSGGVTGIRLEAIQDCSLPGQGPGHHPSSSGAGTFFVTEVVVTASNVSPALPSGGGPIPSGSFPQGTMDAGFQMLATINGVNVTPTNNFAAPGDLLGFTILSPTGSCYPPAVSASAVLVLAAEILCNSLPVPSAPGIYLDTNASILYGPGNPIGFTPTLSGPLSLSYLVPLGLSPLKCMFQSALFFVPVSCAANGLYASSVAPIVQF